MKKILLATILLTSAIWSNAYTITDLPAVPGTTYYWTNTAALINANYAVIATWLNGIDTTNTLRDSRITADEGVLITNTAAIAALQTNLATVYLSPSPALVLATPWTNTYGKTACLIVDGTINMAALGSSTLTFTNLTTTENHIFAGSTVSIAGTTYFSQVLPDVLKSNVVQIIAVNTGTATATLTKTTLRVKP